MTQKREGKLARRQERNCNRSGRKQNNVPTLQHPRTYSNDANGFKNEKSSTKGYNDKEYAVRCEMLYRSSGAVGILRASRQESEKQFCEV